MRIPAAFRSRLGKAHRAALHVLNHRLLGRPVPGPFIVLTTSRSGSTWLCNLLSKALYIEPMREDFRPKHFQGFLGGQLVVNDLLNLAQASFNGTAMPPRLGSKLIWDSIPELKRRLSPADITAFTNLYRENQPVLVRLVRRDRVAQAVSRYIAARSGVFHKHIPTSTALRKDSATSHSTGRSESSSESASAEVSYDFEAIHKHYKPLVRAEKHLDDTLANTQVPVHTFFYEDLVDDPVTGLVDVLSYLLGDEDESLRPYLAQRAVKTIASERLVPTASDLNHRLATRFAQDLSVGTDVSR